MRSTSDYCRMCSLTIECVLLLQLPSARDALNESTPSFLEAAAATVKARGEAAERVKEEGLEK